MTIEELKDLKGIMKKDYIENSAVKEKLLSNIDKENKNIETLSKDMELYEKKKTLLQEASNEARKFSKDMFEVIATEALKTVLGENLSVVIELGELKGIKTADFKIKAEYDTGDVIVDPTEEDGGGAADIVSLASLISINSYLSDENSAPLILDEPTKFVSKGNALDVANFLQEISHDMNRQIIMVTHDGVSKNVASKAFEIELDEHGCSCIKGISENVPEPESEKE